MAADAQSWVVEPDGPVTQAQLIKPQAQQANFGGQGQQLGPGGPQRPPGEPGAINRYRFLMEKEGTSRDGNYFRSRRESAQCCVLYTT